MAYGGENDLSKMKASNIHRRRKLNDEENHENGVWRQ
jgi:hypothetical protein